MKQYLTHIVRSRTCRTIAVVLTLVASLVAGFLAGLPKQVPTLMAQGCGTAFNCAGGTATASLTVDHVYEDSITHDILPVEPVDTDTWQITARWYTTAQSINCTCQQMVSQQADVDVTWSDSTQQWTATCTAGCNAMSGPIYAVNVCPAGGCGGNPPTIPFDHSWAYELIVDAAVLQQPQCVGGGPVNAYLNAVEYVATALDDGDVIDDDECSHDFTVTPDTSGPIGATDYGTFECPFTCTDAAGPSIDIDYVDP